MWSLSFNYRRLPVPPHLPFAGDELLQQVNIDITEDVDLSMQVKVPDVETVAEAAERGGHWRLDREESGPVSGGPPTWIFAAREGGD